MFSLKHNLPKIIGGIIAVVLLLCLGKTWAWEQKYYADKEGSERAELVNMTMGNADDFDETDIEDETIKNHTVAPDRPRYIWIDKIGVKKSRILEVGVSTSGQLQTPVSIFDAGWYTYSGKPGAGGTLLIDGHNGGPTKEGIFKRLPELVQGDIVTIERGDGQIFKYSIVETEAVALNVADSQMKKMQQSPEPGKESLSLITCTGVWSQKQQTYLSRQFIRAVLVE